MNLSINNKANNKGSVGYARKSQIFMAVIQAIVIKAINIHGMIQAYGYLPEQCSSYYVKIGSHSNAAMI